MLIDTSRWLRHDWPDGSVVYDRLTGDTHALHPLAVEYLELPAALHQDIKLASAELARLLERSEDLAWQAELEAVLSQLSRIHLITSPL